MAAAIRPDRAAVAESAAVGGARAATRGEARSPDDRAGGHRDRRHRRTHGGDDARGGARVGFDDGADRYFPNKETLLDAVIDAGTGRPPQFTEPRADWRTEVTQWAHAKRATLCARPWLAELPFVAAPHGPNWLRWLEAITDSLSRTTLDPADIGQMLSIVDGYTRGASDTAVHSRDREREHLGRRWAAGVGADLRARSEIRVFRSLPR
jgi:hypothetical protein